MPRSWSRIVLGLTWLAVLAVSAFFYAREAALEHFVWHLGFGGAFGLVLGGLWMAVRRRPVGHAAGWALAGYLYMIIPDLIWLAPTFRGGAPHAHQAWMDVFLGHVFLDTWALTDALLWPTVLAGSVVYLGVRHAFEVEVAA